HIIKFCPFVTVEVIHPADGSSWIFVFVCNHKVRWVPDGRGNFVICLMTVRTFQCCQTIELWPYFLAEQIGRVVEYHASVLVFRCIREELPPFYRKDTLIDQAFIV